MYNALRVRIQHVRVSVLVERKQFGTQRAGACYTAVFRVQSPNVPVHCHFVLYASWQSITGQSRVLSKSAL